MRQPFASGVRLPSKATPKPSSSSGSCTLKAKAYDRIIEIELEVLTPQAARMRVVANQGKFFFKDAATAIEIINQTAETLDRTAAETREGQKQSRRDYRPPHTHSKPPHTH